MNLIVIHDAQESIFIVVFTAYFNDAEHKMISRHYIMQTSHHYIMQTYPMVTALLRGIKKNTRCRLNQTNFVKSDLVVIMHGKNKH